MNYWSFGKIIHKLRRFWSKFRRWTYKQLLPYQQLWPSRCLLNLIFIGSPQKRKRVYQHYSFKINKLYTYFFSSSNHTFHNNVFWERWWNFQYLHFLDNNILFLMFKRKCFIGDYSLWVKYVLILNYDMNLPSLDLDLLLMQLNHCDWVVFNNWKYLVKPINISEYRNLYI